MLVCDFVIYFVFFNGVGFGSTSFFIFFFSPSFSFILSSFELFVSLVTSSCLLFQMGDFLSLKRCYDFTFWSSLLGNWTIFLWDIASRDIKGLVFAYSTAILSLSRSIYDLNWSIMSCLPLNSTSNSSFNIII